MKHFSVGCPCICTNYESARDIIEDGINGWLVEKTSDAIYNKIIEVIHRDEMINDMKKNWKIFVGVIFLAVCSGCGIKKEQKKTIEDTKEKIYREV